MRPNTLYGSICIFCLVVSFTSADRKWKYNDENPYEKIKTKEGNFKNKLANVDADGKSPDGLKSRKLHQKTKSKSAQVVESDSSEEDNLQQQPLIKEFKSEGNSPGQKKFIGRIEHGKVKVLRRKESNQQPNEINSEEDPKAKVCKKSKSGNKPDCFKNIDGDSSNEDNGNSSEEDKHKGKPQKKIKYSIKFQHEKQKKKEDNGNMRIMRLHKNGKKEYGKDHDDSSEEDDKPIKRFHYIDDDE